MVKVVGEDARLIKTTSCKHCAARLEYTQCEVQTRLTRDYTGDTDRIGFIICPRCAAEVSVPLY